MIRRDWLTIFDRRRRGLLVICPSWAHDYANHIPLGIQYIRYNNNRVCFLSFNIITGEILFVRSLTLFISLLFIKMNFLQHRYEQWINGAYTWYLLSYHLLTVLGIYCTVWLFIIHTAVCYMLLMLFYVIWKINDYLLFSTCSPVILNFL